MVGIRYSPLDVDPPWVVAAYCFFWIPVMPAMTALQPGPHVWPGCPDPTFHSFSQVLKTGPNFGPHMAWAKLYVFRLPWAPHNELSSIFGNCCFTMLLLSFFLSIMVFCLCFVFVQMSVCLHIYVFLVFFLFLFLNLFNLIDFLKFILHTDYSFSSLLSCHPLYCLVYSGFCCLSSL